jgi:hypothetical protein
VLAEEQPDPRKTSDASVDRNILTASAETIGAGEITFNSYELFLAGLTVGITDRVQVSATTLLPVFKDMPFVLALAAKGQLLASPHLRFSLQPDFVIARWGDSSAGIFGLQLLLDVIFDEGGKLVLSLTESNQFAFGERSGDLETLDIMMVGLGATLSVGLGSHVKLLAELTLPGGYADGQVELVKEALLLAYGVRFHGSSVAADIAFVRPMHPDVSGDFTKVLPMGFPLVTFSARF